MKKQLMLGLLVAGILGGATTMKAPVQTRKAIRAFHRKIDNAMVDIGNSIQKYNFTMFEKQYLFHQILNGKGGINDFIKTHHMTMEANKMRR